MAKPFIAAYKAGASSPNAYITSDQIIYWCVALQFTSPVAALEVPLAVGEQSFVLSRGGGNVLAANSLKVVSNVCPCG